MVFEYKAILFDMDGVIIDTMPYHFRAWKIIFMSLGIHLDKFEIYKREGEQGIVTISEILTDHGKLLSTEQMQKLLRAKEDLFKQLTLPRLFPGIKAILNDLKKRGFLLGLVTGTSRDEISHVLPVPLLRSFDVVVSAGEVKKGKPDPEPYLRAINALNIKPGEAIVIENAPYGIKSAKRAGAFCIAITTSLPREYIKEADIVCTSLKEVKELIIGNGLEVKIGKG